MSILLPGIDFDCVTIDLKKVVLTPFLKFVDTFSEICGQIRTLMMGRPFMSNLKNND
jgi:hypothetical protein